MKTMTQSPLAAKTNSLSMIQSLSLSLSLSLKELFLTDYDHEESNPNFLYSTLAHDNLSSYKVCLKNVI